MKNSGGYDGFMTMLLAFFGLISTIIGFIFARKKNIYFVISLFISFITSVFMQYIMYADVCGWVLKEDWSALMDVIPTMKNVIFYYFIVMLCVNFISIIIYVKKHKL